MTPHRTAIHPPPPIAEQTVAGTFVATLAAVADSVVAVGRAEVDTVVWHEHLRAFFQLWAMYLPFGVVAGVVVGLLLTILRATPWLSPLRLRLTQPRSWVRRDPEAFATGLAALIAAGVFFAVEARAAEHFATAYHAPDLAAAAMAAATIGILLGAVLLAAAIAWPLRRLGGHLGGLASVATVVLVAVLGIAGAVAFVLDRNERLLEILDLTAWAWLPGVGLTWIGVAVLVRAFFRRRLPTPRLAWGMAWLALGVTALFLAIAAVSYGSSHRVRGVVERGSVQGRQLVRFWGRLADGDGDGFPAAFGGDDCDDDDPLVHPGALDPPGDGVDADCFDGDGSREVAELGDGHYAPVSAALSRPNILLVSIDALRPDHLGSYGYRRATSPNLDRFAKQGARFERVIAPSSRSIRSIPSMFTGLYPSQIAFGSEYIWPSILPSNQMVAEMLAGRGYQTAAVMGTDYFARTGGFFQGFGEVRQSMTYKPPRDWPVTEGIVQMQRLAGQSQPWFLWVHLFNVHEPYLGDGAPSRYGRRPIDRYDTEINHADAEVQRLLDELTRLGQQERTVVVVASDHGEAFGEHRNYGHSTTLHEEELRSTLLIRAPRVPPRVVPDTVSLMDVGPTLLNFADVPMPRPVPARSLLPLITGQAPRRPPPTSSAQRLIFSELMPDGLFPYDQKSIRRGSKKLIWSVREGTYQLYDLARDPQERNNLADERPDEARELLGLLRAWVGQTNLAENRHLDVVARNRLRAPPLSMTRRLDVRFATFTLLGFDIPRTQYRPGERIPITFYYRVEQETPRNLFFYVNFDTPPGYGRLPFHFHGHHYPLNGRYRTFEWRDGEILRDPLEMIIPADTRVPVTLRMTLAVLDSGARIPFSPDPRGDKVLDLVEIEIR